MGVGSLGDGAVRADLPLSGVRVVDLADGRGELCGRLLADLGADVIRVEPPGGAQSRGLTPLVNGVSLHFATHNANKRGAEIDLTTPAGRVTFLEMAEQADILIEAEPAGRLDQLGLGTDVLHEHNPALVITSITDFGQNGPYRNWSATDFVHHALNGVLARSGAPGERPLMPPGSLPTETAAVQAAWSTLVAFWRRLNLGVGEHVDASIHESSIQSIDPAFGMGGTATAGMVARDLPRDRPDARRNYPIFSCADGHVRVCVLGERQWHSMFKWLGSPPEWADPALDDMRARNARSADLHPLYAALVRNRTRAELVIEGRTRGIPIEGVMTPGEALDSEHFRARGAWTSVELSGAVTGLMPSGFWEVDGLRAGIRTPAPAPGGNARFAGERAEFGRLRQRQSTTPACGPLSGLRVLDVGVIVLGAETTRLFADMGADVVKVESSRYPDGVRYFGMNYTFAYGHRNKRSLGIDLRNPAGKQLFLDLVANADVVTSNFKPGTLESLGLGPDVLRAVNPAIVAIESSALGSWGPSSGNMGYGPLVRSATGLTSVWRYPEQPDGFCDAMTVYPDHTGARIGAIGTLAALIGRRRSGHGSRVVTAQAETILGEFSTEFLRESVEPGSFRALGNTGEYDAPYGLYPCAGDDEWCVVTIRGNDDWRRLCAVIGAQDLADDEALANSVGRVAQRERIDKTVLAWTTARTPQHVMHALQDEGVPAAMMVRPVQLPFDPHLVGRGFYVKLAQPELGDMFTETGPAHFDHIDDPEIRRAPAFATHTREVITQWLGLSDDEIAALVEQCVLEDPAVNRPTSGGL
jgi:crotonobetainyl-CoA:carnitine CoA-transferase CaiB-like acyl-CoA transferase